jgi:hypothetical protein
VPNILVFHVVSYLAHSQKVCPNHIGWCIIAMCVFIFYWCLAMIVGPCISEPYPVLNVGTSETRRFYLCLKENLCSIHDFHGELKLNCSFSCMSRSFYEQTDSEAKRFKANKCSNDNSSKKTEAQTDSKSAGKAASQNPPAPEPPKQDYIHVKARRGQATDSHSLAERVC